MKSFKERAVLFARFQRRISTKVLPVNPVKLRQKRLSLTGRGIIAKQILKRYYLNIKESGFRSYVASAVRNAKKIGKGEQRYVEDTLVGVLEVRLDALLSRLCLVKSPHFGRQLISHGKVLVNGVKVDVPSLHIKVGDIITFSDSKLTKLLFVRFLRLLIACKKRKEGGKLPSMHRKATKKQHFSWNKQNKQNYFKGKRNNNRWSKPRFGKTFNQRYVDVVTPQKKKKKVHSLILPLYVSNRLIYLTFSSKLGALMLLHAPQKLKDVHYPFALDMHALLMHYKFIRG